MILLRGKVIKGRGLGRRLGYPTANIRCVNCPTAGVYAARAVLGGKIYKCVAAVRDNLAEILLFDFQGDLYGQELEVEILKKVSEIKKFDNEEGLIKKIKADVNLCLRG